MISRNNTLLAGSILILMGLSAWVQTDYSRPNIEILPDMKYTDAWQAYAANPVFQNGRTLQGAVRGTIARGDLPLHFTASKEDAIRAGNELQNPFTLPPSKSVTKGTPEEKPKTLAGGTPAGGSPAPVIASTTPPAVPPVDPRVASEARGAALFRIYCIACHGPQGAGDGPVAQRGFPPPPPLPNGKSVQMKDGQVFHVLTYGQGSMPPFAGQLTQTARWDLVNHLRQMQRDAAAKPGVSPK